MPLICSAATGTPCLPRDRNPFGPNVFIFSPATDTQQMQAQINQVYARQQHSEFGIGRYAFLFAPGEYKVDIPIGFYTQVAGLGVLPDQVHITGDVRVDAASPHNNATTTFWRGAEGFAVSPAGGTLPWAVSQAVFLRRMHILGNLVLHQEHGWASGGWLSDSRIDGMVDSGTQQQWLSRNAEWKSWTGANWNMVFVGVTQPPAGEWPKPPYTRVAATPVVREKPFLALAEDGRYVVRVPALQHDTVGVNWARGDAAGRSIPLSHFYIARDDRDTAATINAALRRGKDLLLTPGIYRLAQPLHVTRKDTVVLGLGFATLKPVAGTAAMDVDDVDGVTVASLLFDAGPLPSPVLLQVGSPGRHLPHVTDPISLHDIFFRVGGAGVGKTVANLIIDSDNTIVDHTWIWRADHGDGVGWTSNTSNNGLIVNGNDVTVYGLFVEHHQQYQVLWNGDRGRTYFYQSELPYDAPDQKSWMSPAGTDGWSSYKVGADVTTHQAWGLGIYSVFLHPGVQLDHAIDTPVKPGICFDHMVTIALVKLGQITHVADDEGATARPGAGMKATLDHSPGCRDAR